MAVVPLAEGKPARPLAHRFHYMLRPVFAQVGAEWLKPPLTFYGVAGTAVGLAIIVAGVVEVSLG